MELVYDVDFSPWAAPLQLAARKMSNLRPALDDVGEIVEGITRRNMDDGGGPIDWPDLSVATLIARARNPSGPQGKTHAVFGYGRSMGPAHARESRVLGSVGRMPRWLRELHGIGESGPVALTKKARLVIESAKPLIWTRALYRSITHIVGGDYVDIGSPLEKSWTLFFGSRAGKKPVVPARNPWGLTPSDEASIVSTFVRHILGGIVRGLA